MNKLLRRIYSVSFMLKKKSSIGEIPSTNDVYKTAIDMAWPSAMEAVLVSLVTSIDTMMVGKLGAGAIAAVGITNQPKFILLAFIFSLNIGVTAVVARRKGENNRKGANRCLRQAVFISLMFSAVLSIIGFVFARPLLLFVGAQEDVIEMAVTYFRIIAIGNFFTSVSLTINAAQRGSGNTKISMRTNIVANIINLIFNYFLINGYLGFPKLGIAGAGIATLIGNIVAFLMSIKSIRNKSGFLHISIKDNWKFDKFTVKSILNISSSSFVEQICIRIGFLMTTKLVASIGTVEFATHLICMNIVNLSFSFGNGLGIGASALVGQNLGAKRPDMSYIYSKTIQRIALTVGIILFCVFILGRHLLVELFTDEQSIISIGSKILIIIAFTSPIQTQAVVIAGTLRGAGDTKFVAFTSLISIGLVRPFTTWLFCYPLGFGILGAWFAFFTDQLLRFLINSIRFKTGKWAKIKI
ncbi:MATE family efflux transporter [Sedimentibacter sp. zth1]|uniref:MATE family efflux transporter n=1 Tax=Sedimentibacter sp. zth1 TaxID=2816908 RepID=UPI001A9262E6|nr:MATE family efflux transporter [Sedimentibacter sp. zth1]QSX05218.1 MATE family efflux transporter [Sedimentibacter sp. zth1]